MTAGVCLIDDKWRIEYQIIALEYIPNKLIRIEAVCLHPTQRFDRELVFKLETENLFINDKRLEIAFSIINSTIKNIELPEKSKLHKLIIRNREVFYLCELK